MNPPSFKRGKLKKSHIIIYIFQLIEEIQSQSTITAGMLNESHQQCCELEQQVKRAKVEHADNTQNSSNTSREDHLALLRTEEGMPRAPHLRSLKEKRCQLDSLSSEFCNKIDGMLQELTKVGLSS